jgi:diguanylate cyclase (GGDEF)-like protein
MTTEPFLEADFRVLTPGAFDFVLNNELKRAVRSQNFLTLLLVEPSFKDAPGSGNGEREQLVRQIARLVSREVRETDVLSQTDKHRLSIVLLDADLQSSMHVIKRLKSRIENHEFSRPIEIEVGAACCPTHGADAESLRRAAEPRAANRRRDTGGIP